MIPMLGPRLASVAELLPPDRPFADIGTDHAHLPCAMVLTGRVPRVVACDRARGPLATAAATVQRWGVASQVDLRLGPGLAPLQPQEVAAVAIAGMGPDTILQILANHYDRARDLQRLVLQPNFGHERVRRWLVAHGFAVVDERLVSERGRYYTAIAASPADPSQPPPAWDPAAWCFGPFVLQRGGPVLREFLTDILQRNAHARAAAGIAASSALVAEHALVSATLVRWANARHPGADE